MVSRVSAWRRNQRSDQHYRRARAEGVRARSVYKLEEIDQRFGILRPGAKVIDLGAAPGSWSEYAVGRVGAHGQVVAVDLSEIEPLNDVVSLTGDIGDPSLVARLHALLPRGADVVLSDAAPAISGIRATDDARSVALVEAALSIAVQVLRPGGAFLVKVFRGGDLASLVARIEAALGECRLIVPRATRAESREAYVFVWARRDLHVSHGESADRH
ncbi:MAG: RlmE family RNA methyltransferase [Chloroflexi bacterium]|nr:RlmE family RNA methyltransferase [Chloroflexota bacterium]